MKVSYYTQFKIKEGACPHFLIQNFRFLQYYIVSCVFSLVWMMPAPQNWLHFTEDMIQMSIEVLILL